MRVAELFAGIDKVAGSLWRLRCVAALAAVYLLLNHRYFVDPHPEQNSCQFGTVTNEEYRAMLGRASELSRSKWAQVGGDEREISARLKERIAELSGENPGIYKQMVTTHAVMRQLHAHLSEAGSVVYQTWDGGDPPVSQQSIHLYYSIPSLSFRNLPYSKRTREYFLGSTSTAVSLIEKC
jgi:hypothetical protein